MGDAHVDLRAAQTGEDARDQQTAEARRESPHEAAESAEGGRQCDADKRAVSIEQPPADKLDLQEIVPCQNCGQKTPYDGYFQHCVHCGDKLNTLVKICSVCDKGVMYHPSFGFCPVCGGDLKPDFYNAPPLNELDPNGLIWGIPSREEDAGSAEPPGPGV